MNGDINSTIEPHFFQTFLFYIRPSASVSAYKWYLQLGNTYHESSLLLTLRSRSVYYANAHASDNAFFKFTNDPLSYQKSTSSPQLPVLA